MPVSDSKILQDNAIDCGLNPASDESVEAKI
jgi:hypothetical protein